MSANPEDTLLTRLREIATEAAREIVRLRRENEDLKQRQVLDDYVSNWDPHKGALRDGHNA
jgi:hypothetical protein